MFASIKHVTHGLAGLAMVLMATAAQAAPSIYPTGTTIYDPAQSLNGYVLIGGNNKFTNSFDTRKRAGEFKDNDWTGIVNPEKVIIDMNGNVVHRWANAPGDRMELLPNGNLLTLDQAGKRMVEFDWDGNVVWEFKTNLGPHHDFERLPNGNTLILTFEKVPVEKLAGVKDITVPWWGDVKRQGVNLTGDTIIEVNPKGEVVWEWKSSDHLDVNRFMPLRPLWDWTHGNTLNVLPENKLFDAGDKRFKPGNIIYNPRHMDEVQLIDRETGDIVWTWSTKKMGGLSNAHEPNMIPKGMPGEGNILIYDNGLFPKSGAHSGQTAIYEIDPATGKIVWTYTTVINGNSKFFGKIMGTVFKLPNGNVMTSEDPIGRVFQIKPDPTHPDGGEIVWEYISESNLARPTIYPYDFTPQLKKMSKPKEMKVSPIDPATWKLLPDEMRKNGVVSTITK